MNAAEQFNSLNGKLKVSRKTLETLLAKAKRERDTRVSSRVIVILDSNPDKTLFSIELKSLIKPYGLNAPRHSGFAKVGLDCYGRLYPGYMFDGNGNVVPSPNTIAGIAPPKRKRKTSNCTTEKPDCPETKIVVAEKKKTTKKIVAPIVEKRKATSDYGKKRKRIKNNNLVEKTEKYDFIYEVTSKGYDIKSFFNLSLSKSVKNKVLSDTIDGLFYYDATEIGLKSLKKEFPNNRYGDKQSLSSKDLNKPSKPTPPTNNNDNNGNKKKNTTVKTANVKPAKTKTIDKEVKKNQSSDVYVMKLANIHLDIKRFQNRDALDENKVNNIVNNFDSVQFDPLIVWHDPKQNKDFLLAGHHRYEALKRLKKVNVNVKFANDKNEAQAIKYAIEESNANRTLEQPFERAKIYAKLFSNGATKTALKEKAKAQEGKNATEVLNLAFLNANGSVIQSLKSLKNTPDVQSQELIKTIADWIGNARFNNEKLTNAHETEMFKFLSDKSNFQRIKNRADFLHKMSSVATMFFDYSNSLNLERFKYKTEGESVYDLEYNELKNRIETIINNKQSLLDRIKNPFNKDFIKPTDKDYNSIIKALDVAIAKYDNELKAVQKKIIELSQKKGKYTSAGSNQVGLFKPKRKTLLDIFKNSKSPDNLKVSDAINNGYSKTQITNFLNSYYDFSKKQALKFYDLNASKPALKQPENTNSLAYKLANKNAQPHEYYIIPDKQIAQFIGKLEKKNKESVAITLAGGEGSMKTRLCFQLMNCFAQNYKVGHASIEEHPESSLYENKINQYLTAPNVLSNITAPEIKSIQDVHKLVQENDVIIIDSFSKLEEMQRGIGLDKDFRKAYDGKLFIIIFQLTTDGKMRGGSKSQFDGDIIGKINVELDYKNNTAYWSKNRYCNANLSEHKFNIFSKKMVELPKPIEQTTTTQNKWS